jgi:DNA-binding winged helix-turn-helix (wHTH) protein/tetratricopeptide (TPR) repeat protein
MGCGPMMPPSLLHVEPREPEFSFGSFTLWPDGSLFRGQAQIHLPPKELGALRFLLTHAGQVVTSAQLKQALWGDVHVTSDSVPRCVSSLRARLEPEQCIQTIYKRGYRLTGLVRRPGPLSPTPWRLVVMPFASGHNVAEHLGPSIADEVTTRLTATAPAWLSVLARDSVFTLARRDLTAVQVGEALQADLVLAGTLTAMPTHYRLRVEMIRVQDGTQIWVEDMLAGHGQILELESELVQQLLFRLEGEWLPDLPLAGDPTRPNAHEIYLRGHYEWQTHEQRQMQDAMQFLIQATELDPSLVSAKLDMAHLAVTQELYGFLSPHGAAKQVYQIRDSISDIQGEAPALLPILGWLKFHVDRDLDGALDLFSASADLGHDPSTTRLRAMFALSRHRFDEALAWLQPALLIDPFAPWLHAQLAWTWHLAGEREKSVEAIEKAMSLFPDHEATQLCGALVLAFNGQAERGASLAQETARRAPYFDVAAAIHAYALACAGHRDEAYGVLERLQWLSRERFVLRAFTAAAFVALGALDEAVAELRAADDARCPWFFQMLSDPRLEPLHQIPEFQEMRAALENMDIPAEESLEYSM